MVPPSTLTRPRAAGREQRHTPLPGGSLEFACGPVRAETPQPGIFPGHTVADEANWSHFVRVSQTFRPFLADTTPDQECSPVAATLQDAGPEEEDPFVIGIIL